MISPNHLRMGRLNMRVLDGPMRLPKNREEQLDIITKMYDPWFRIWRDTYVPKLMHQPIWFKTNRDLVVGDLVYFIKKDSKGGQQMDNGNGRGDQPRQGWYHQGGCDQILQ